MSPRVVLNPEARGARRRLNAVRAAIADCRLLADSEIRIAEDWDEGRTLALRAAEEGHRLVVAAGGDGTVNSVVHGLMEAGPPRPVLGILPLGTGNDLARSLGIPRNVSEALEELERRVVREMDVLEVRGDGVARYCSNVASGGFSGRVDEELTDDTKDSWGPLAYLRTAVGRATDLETYSTTLVVDGGRERLEREVTNLAVANARYAAGGVRVAPDAVLDDGCMDVIVIGAGPLAQLGAVAARLAAGRHLDHELVSAFRARELTVASDPPMSFNVDGEPIGRGGFRFRVLPRALPVLVGEGRPGTL